MKHANPVETVGKTVSAGPGGSVSGVVTVPGDKSMSHRSVMMASIADGVSHIDGFLAGEDSLNTVAAFRSMGVTIDQTAPTSMTIHGVGMHGLQSPDADLYMGNAGTGMRLIAGLLAAQEFNSVLTGDESLSRRPMGRVVDPLTAMGAIIEGDDKGRPPLKITAPDNIQGIEYSLPMASAQVKSCVLLAGLYASGTTSVIEPAITRDHTERMLRGFGYTVISSDNGLVSLEGGGSLKACDMNIPADISSAAFLIVAASIAPDADITLTNIGINPTRTGVIDILRLMGANIELQNTRQSGDEPVADIRVRSAQLKGVAIPESLVPLAIDELPVVFIAAAVADGTSIVTGAEELRVKESDRIDAMAEGLKTLGVDATATPDGMIINGGSIGGGTVETFFDHRIAMAFCIASLRSNAPVIIKDTQHVETSFPGFFKLCSQIGLNINEALEV